MKTIRFGIVGTGNITSWVLKGATMDPRFKAVAIYSRTQSKGDEFALKHGIPQVYTSLEEMLEKAGIDAVYIASPNSLHASQSIVCMEHNKHVLCEKPLASDANEARDMIETARRKKVLLMEAMIATLNPNFARVCENIERTGKINRYFSSYCQYSSRYDSLKAGELPNVFNPALSGGGVLDIGIYTIYPMVALFGRPESVTAHGITLSSGVDGQGTIQCRYPGMEATLIYSKIANSYLPTEIQGEKGNILIDKINNMHEVTFIPRPAATSGRSDKIEKIDLSVSPFLDPYYYEIKEFIDILEAGGCESRVNTLTNSLIALEIADETRRQILKSNF
ncbi:MAG: Gfo/Idh/MocA family oxidoreductase [Clostridiales bacterium]|nr:Gfo/Idh/MocA family oxidoreductase [Clostridiales bacterium]